MSTISVAEADVETPKMSNWQGARTASPRRVLLKPEQQCSPLSRPSGDGREEPMGSCWAEPP